MFTRRLPAAMLVSLLFLLCIPAQAFVGGIAVSIGRATNTEGAEIPPFSADAQLETEEHTLNSHVYYKPGMVRDVTDMGGMEMVTIQRFDEGKVWVLMGQGMYMETEIGEAEQAPEYQLIERTVEGKETVNGMETTKYKTIYEGPDGRFGGFTWFTDDNIAVKGFIVSDTKGEKQRLQWTMTNVQRGEQPAALFELPPGARPMGGMGGLMDMMGMGSAKPEGTADDPNDGGEASLQDAANSVLKGVSEGFGKMFGN
tara:strand:- start:27012 stop:27779 length:768 start_codon:yes stop_codon:yes gene_type:complete